jgi:hypothetical protein
MDLGATVRKRVKSRIPFLGKAIEIYIGKTPCKMSAATSTPHQVLLASEHFQKI